ncbi:MAG: chloride channel protein [Rhodospirillales bacterium CG15_BIG_FIL_POST_REV_8_21_14_020_66_15]|nr:MAG: chloride channel protein [Rhodospirillales bacterium CG15_BIG_FIL_POST_REV_8_21_14_020_66_15]
MVISRFKYARLLLAARRVIRNDHLILMVLALVVGCAAGAAVVAFRETIDLVQFLFYGTGHARLTPHAAGLQWWHVLLAPAVGGLIVGIFVHLLLPNRRPQGVADVIEAEQLHGGWMSSRVGLLSAIASAISIGAGASVGREGPAVHLGGSLGAWLARRLHLTRSLNRTLLGCGVAAAVAASFNAPLAGALFANEVVIGHYALKAFAPVVVASVAGTAISRHWFGNFPAFALVDNPLASFWEFPAFIGLGVASALCAILMMHSIVVASALAKRTPMVPWLKPAVAGLSVGAMALVVPQVLGVGYGVTEDAMLHVYGFGTLLVILACKILATAISLGWGFSGGVFSPALVVGAVAGGAYGIVATAIFPDLSSGVPAYTVVGMGAVAASVLGAPISTTLIIFEMTSDYTLTLAVMVTVVVSSEISHHFYDRSFFVRQLRERGVDLREGIESEVMQTITVDAVMRRQVSTVGMSTDLDTLRRLLQDSTVGELFVVRDDGALHGTVTLQDLSEFAFDHDLDSLVNAGDVARPNPPVLTRHDDIETAVALMDRVGEMVIPVLEREGDRVLVGAVTHDDVMTEFNRVLMERRREELGHE